MKITFIRPNMIAARSSDALQPLAFAVLACRTPQYVELAFYDERLEMIDMEHDTDLIAISIETYTAQRAYEISNHFRSRGIPVVMGGYHPTFLPEEALRFSDSVVIGDAENLWEQVVEDTRKNQLKPIYQHSDPPQTTDFRFERNIFTGKNYTNLIPVQYGRGCRYSCDFCSIHSYHRFNLRQRPINDMVAELKTLGSKRILFVDDNLFINHAVTKSFLHEINDLNIHWVCQMSIDVARDPTLLDLMADSGCMVIQIGLESLNIDNLTQMNKQWALKNQEYSTAIKRIRERGIMVYGTFVFGYDQDTPDTIKACLDFAIENKFCLANFNPLTPMPGTKLYNRLHTENRLLFDKWWLDPDYTYGEAAFMPSGMSATELTDSCYWARTQFNTHRSITKRGLDSQANAYNFHNLTVYVAANLISRKEIHKKQGYTLGANNINIHDKALS